MPLLCALLIAGPLSLRTQGTLRELFLDVTGADARPLAAPELDLRWAFANDWNAPMRLDRGADRADQLIDEQADSLTASYRAPWRRLPWVWSAVEARVTEHWGGWSDRPIEAWHRLTGAFNYQRSDAPRNRIRLVYADSGGTAFDLSHPVFAVGDLVLRTQATLLARGPLALAARFDLKAPLGSLARAGGSGGFDEGFALLGTVQLAPWAALHALGAVSHFGSLSAPTLLQPKPWHFSLEGSLELTFWNTTFLVEDRCLSPLLMPGWKREPDGGDDGLLASGFYADFRAHNQVSLGVRRGRFSAWMSEDFTPGPNPRSTINWVWVSNAPDIVVGVAFTQRL